MRLFHLLKKDMVMKFSKTFKLALLTLFSGWILIFLLSLIKNSFGEVISKYLVYIVFVYALFVIIGSLVLLNKKSEKNPFTKMEFTDMSIILTSDIKTEEYPIVGLAYVELDIDSFRPAVMARFVYNENKYFDVMVSGKEYSELIRVFDEFNINHEKNIYKK